MAEDLRRPGPRSKRIRCGWALEATALVLTLYPLYGWARDLVDAPRLRALRNARQVIDWQQRLGINHERTIQEWLLPYRWFIGFWNLFYGSIHFVAPVVTLVALYHFAPARYVRWRNTFLWILVFALIGYWLYPLMPPRLLPSSFGFVDTRLTYFTIGKPVPHAREVGILYAAMPSIHIAWATWAVFALWPLVRRRWARMLLLSYPALIIFATVVTANHYFLDAVGAWGALALAYTLASWRDWMPRRRRRGVPAAARQDGLVKHVSPMGLDDLDDLLRDLRRVDGLTENQRGVFYRGSRAFLHFHEDPTGLYCDVRVNTDFERMRVQTKAERKRLLSIVRAAVQR